MTTTTKLRFNKMLPTEHTLKQKQKQKSLRINR